MDPWELKWTLGVQMEPRGRKWSPGSRNGALVARMEPWELKWSPGRSNGTLES